MILHASDGQLRLVTQNDHAHFAAELLSLWHGDDLPEHPRRQTLIFAVREHDNGWREVDSAPRCDADSGRPFDFLNLPRAERWQLWQRGIERFAAERPYAAALHAEHALHLHRDLAEGCEILDGWRQLQADLLAAEPEAASCLAADYPWLEVSDLLSLVVCNGWTKPFELRGRKGFLRHNTLHLEPFPFVGATAFEIPCRHIPDRRYRGDADLGTALATARWSRLRVRVAPTEP